MQTSTLDILAQHSILQLVKGDITIAENDDDLRNRLAVNGYGFSDTKTGRILVTIPHHVELFPLNDAYSPDL